MPGVRLDIISIGTLSRNLLWNESEPTRTPHATTTLIRSDDRHILVDPGLPPQVIAARLIERSGVRPQQIDTVFLTSFRPAHRAGLEAFSAARIIIHEHEQQFARQQLERLEDRARSGDIDLTALQRELKLLDSLKPAEDQLAPAVDLFPLSGHTPGTCGLLVSLPTITILVAGDAVPTQDHFLAGQVLPEAHDVRLAKESLMEAYEIADLIVPGHDNIFLNPRSQGI